MHAILRLFAILSIFVAAILHIPVWIFTGKTLLGDVWDWWDDNYLDT